MTSMCNRCHREGDLVCQTVRPKPQNSRFPSDPKGPWVFRYYLCRWHRAAGNRTRMAGLRRIKIINYIDDAILLRRAAR
jgi:hypothetical protein